MQGATNREMISKVAGGLGDLVKEVVFVGGAITELYVEDTSQVSEIRQTDDVDCIIEITSRIKFANLEERIRKQGFENDRKVICRWHYEGIIVDIMPTETKILGFTNRWYKEGIIHSIHFDLDKNNRIRILSVPYFIACKLEALFNRGLADLRLSKDLEDIVFLLNNSVNFIANNQALSIYISDKVSVLLGKPELREAIFCVLPFGENEPQYVNHIMSELNKMIIS